VGGGCEPYNQKPGMGVSESRERFGPVGVQTVAPGTVLGGPPPMFHKPWTKPA